MEPREQRIQFYDALYAECSEAEINLRTIGKSGITRSEFIPVGGDSIEQMEAFVNRYNNNDDLIGLYHAVATRNGGGKKEHIVEIPALWAEVDFKDTPKNEAKERLNDFYFPPSAQIASGGGLHNYWFLNEPATKENIPLVEATLKQLGRVLGADPQAAEAARILRIPGTINRKYDPARPVKLVYCDTQKRYNLEDIADFLIGIKAEWEAAEESTPRTIPPCISYIINHRPPRSDKVNFNKLVVHLITYFQRQNWNKKDVWQVVQPFVENYLYSDTYSTKESRIAEWRKQWQYLTKNENYTFDCSYIKGLDLPRSAFECDECIGHKEKLSYAQAILSATEFVNLQIPPRESLLNPIIKEGSLTEIYGPRGVGKTMLAQSITEGIAYNTGFAPWTAGKQVPCLYFEGEMPTQDMIERLNMFGVEEGLFIYSDAYASTLGLPKANLLNDEWQEQIREQLISLNVKFWVVDNLASLTPGADEISKKDYDPVNQFFLQLRFLGISTTFIHHSGKSGEQRGTSAKEDNVDTVIKLSYPPDYSQEDGCRFILTFEKARLRTKDLVHTKQMEFQFTENEHGKPIWTHKTVKAATKVRILQLLDEGISQKGVAEMLEVDPGYVSRVRKLAIEDKWMTKNNKITQTGYRMIFDEEN